MKTLRKNGAYREREEMSEYKLMTTGMAMKTAPCFMVLIRKALERARATSPPRGAGVSSDVCGGGCAGGEARGPAGSDGSVDGRLAPPTEWSSIRR